MMINTKPDKTPWRESIVVEHARRSVIEPNFFIIEGLLPKKPAQILWPSVRDTKTARKKRRESFSVTNIAFFAFPRLPAPNSLDTLVLS